MGSNPTSLLAFNPGAGTPPGFDSAFAPGGGVYPATVHAGAMPGGSTVNRIQAAIDLAASTGATMVFVPASMLPYDASAVTFNTSVRMVREGGDPSVYDVKAYGAAGDGSSNDTAAVQQAVNLLEAQGGGGTLFFPPGAYVLGSIAFTQNPNGTIRIQGAGRGATTLMPTVPKMFSVGVPGGQVNALDISDFTVQLTQDIGYVNGIIQLVGCVYWKVSRLTFLGGPIANTDSFAAYLLELDSSFNGTCQNLLADGRQVYLVDMNSVSVPGIQADSIDFLRCQANSVVGMMIRNGAGNFNCLFWETFKHVLRAGWPEQSVSIESTLNGATLAGAGSATFTSVANLAIGDLVLVGEGTTIELVKISKIAGNVVSFASNLRFAHSNGDPTLKGGVGVTTSPNSYGFEFHACHFEFSACGVMGSGTRQVLITSPFGTTREAYRAIGPGTGSSCIDLMVMGGSLSGNGGVNNVVRITTLADNAINRVNCYGGFFNPGTGNPPATIIATDSGIQRNYQIVWRNEGTSADRGDASVVLLLQADVATQIFNTPLTAARTVTLPAAGAYPGQKYRIVRTAAATGASTLTVQALLNGNKALAAGQMVEASWNGAAWVEISGAALL